jgi:hypothetical protein
MLSKLRPARRSWFRSFVRWSCRALGVFLLLLVGVLVWLAIDEAPTPRPHLSPRPRSDSEAQTRWVRLAHECERLTKVVEHLFDGAEFLHEEPAESAPKRLEHEPAPESEELTLLRLVRDRPSAKFSALAAEMQVALRKPLQAAQGGPLEMPLPTEFEWENLLRTGALSGAMFVDIGMRIQRGARDDALARIEAGYQLVAQIEAAGGDTATLSAAGALRRSLLRALILFAEKADAEPGMGERLIALVEQVRPRAEDYREALKVDLHRAYLLIDYVRTTHDRKEQQRDIRVAAVFSYLPPRFLRRLALRPEETRRRITEIGERRLADLENGPLNETAVQELYPRVFWRPNPIGRQMVYTAAPSDSICTFFQSEQTRLSALQAWLALRAYEREHGSYPESLDALVPAWLPAVPRDFMNGGVVQYDFARRAVWSRDRLEVGERLRTDIFPRRGWIVFWLAPEDPKSAPESDRWSPVYESVPSLL